MNFRHVSGDTQQKQFPTANGSGVAVLDYNNDGWMDVYFASNCHLPQGQPADGINRLFRNKGDGTFEDVTESAGVGFRGFCHGVIAADIDNDGDTDLFLCNYGPNVLYENRGDGTFVDISKKAGVDSFHWSSSAAFFDYDNDGDLDLYVSNYGIWDPVEDDKFCGDRKNNIRLYCSPRTIRTVKHILYRNNGNNTFTDVTDAAGVSRDDGHGFGVVAADLNGDGLIDLWVANDLNPKFLYLNNGDGTFRDATDLSGAALDVNGNAQAGMGVDAEDVDGDGLPELFATHFQNEYNTLYQNLGNGGFFDQTAAFGLAADSIPYVGWGCGLVDFNNDGWPDCFVANGHVDNNRHILYPGTARDFEQPALLFLNEGIGAPPNQGRRFRLSTRDVGAYFEAKHVSRGCAFGDLDNDGRIDIAISERDGPAALLHNETPRENNRWISLKLVGTRSNRDAIGAKIEVQVGKRTIYRQKKGGCSLMSTNDPRVLIGLGDAVEVAKLTIRWPSGTLTVLEGLACDRLHEIVESKGEEGQP
ncbi:MAG: CRTAC1 family protein [Isosphaeraceae bacterium]